MQGRSSFLRAAGAAFAALLLSLPAQAADLAAGRIDATLVAAIAVRKGDTELRDKLNAAIEAVRANGSHMKIQDQYFDFDIYGK